MEQNKENVILNKEPEANWENGTLTNGQQENFATEVFRQFAIHSRIAIIAMAAVLAFGAWLYYKNDVNWQELFSSYDYVYQDGEGYNNYNTGSQGDVNNGSTGTETNK